MVDKEQLFDGLVEESFKSRINNPKDFELVLDIDDAAEFVEVVQNFSGFLEALFITQVTNQCHLQIRFSEVDEIMIYEDRELDTPEYIPLGVLARRDGDMGLSMSSRRWLLNDDLLIRLGGPVGTRVVLKLRII